MSDNPLSEEILPDVQPEHLQLQLEATASHPVSGYLGEEVDPHVATISFQGVVERNKVSPETPQG